jgi:hypothetical protein
MHNLTTQALYDQNLKRPWLEICLFCEVMAFRATLKFEYLHEIESEFENILSYVSGVHIGVDS